MALQNQGSFCLVHYNSPFISALFVNLIPSYCTQVIVHLILQVESGFTKGSSSSGCVLFTTSKMRLVFFQRRKFRARVLFYVLAWQWYPDLYIFLLVLFFLSPDVLFFWLWPKNYFKMSFLKSHSAFIDLFEKIEVYEHNTGKMIDL